jgi:2-oxoisovalerate dehydrogenase E1 component alpha subunit
MPTYRVMDEGGAILPGCAIDSDLTQDVILRVYRTMVRSMAIDKVLYESQRQGRISFFLTSYGEEGAVLGAAAALRPDDEVFAQYRELSLLLWRGFTMEAVVDQCFSSVDDVGKGRMMPVHYGSRAHFFQTISSPLGTQIPQAAGAAYAHKLDKNGRVALCFFGEGAASEGDFHAGVNFAATTRAPVIFFCRNNQWAISTPSHEQYGGDGIAGRGLAFGLHTIRVDAGDIFACYEAVKRARAIALADGGQPVMVESMGYRESHHSTSDDSTRYRSTEEIEAWRLKSNPVVRLRAHLVARGWWSDAQERELVAAEKRAVLDTIAKVEAKPKYPLAGLFEDVYKEKPAHLAEQEAEMLEHLKLYPPAAGH